MKRTLIRIDEKKCTGCGLCITNCPEGALQLINGKARLVGDLLCDGLGACIGHCPEGAILLEERDAEPYNERLVLENILPQGYDVLRAHLKHLRDHNQTDDYREALAILKEKGLPPGEFEPAAPTAAAHGCPGSASRRLQIKPQSDTAAPNSAQPSALSHWPLQLHLLSPTAPQYRNADVLLAADCVAFAAGNFHSDFLRGKALAIACPKLDQRQEIYLEKLRGMIDEAGIKSLTVAIMEVPCCGGLFALARQAAQTATRKIPIERIVVGVGGDVLERQTLQPD